MRRAIFRSSHPLQREREVDLQGAIYVIAGFPRPSWIGKEHLACHDREGAIVRRVVAAWVAFAVNFHMEFTSSTPTCVQSNPAATDYHFRKSFVARDQRNFRPLSPRYHASSSLRKQLVSTSNALLHAMSAFLEESRLFIREYARTRARDLYMISTFGEEFRMFSEEYQRLGDEVHVRACRNLLRNGHIDILRAVSQSSDKGEVIRGFREEVATKQAELAAEKAALLEKEVIMEAPDHKPEHPFTRMDLRSDLASIDVEVQRSVDTEIMLVRLERRLNDGFEGDERAIENWLQGRCDQLLMETL